MLNVNEIDATLLKPFSDLRRVSSRQISPNSIIRFIADNLNLQELRLYMNVKDLESVCSAIERGLFRITTAQNRWLRILLNVRWWENYDMDDATFFLIRLLRQLALRGIVTA